MPIERCTLNNGGKGWKWGESGTCYPTRAEALRQARAAYAAGYEKQNKLRVKAKMFDNLDKQLLIILTGDEFKFTEDEAYAFIKGGLKSAIGFRYGFHDNEYEEMEEMTDNQKNQILNVIRTK